MISKDPKRTLPHREPFLFVHRFMQRNETGTEGVVEYDVHPDLDVFRGHFPGNPIFPGVLQMEAAAQACGWVYLGVLPEGTPNPDVLFVAVDSYKFRKPVVPPGTLVMKVRQDQVRGPLQLWDIRIEMNSQKVSEGRFWLRML
jgi:3-hydroxymyristoyl/3-hydroxydecanoyl-(acyl carrier protein) dehydratase